MYRNAFNYVGIDGALSKQIDVFYFFCFILEYVDEQSADRFSFCFRVGFALQLTIKYCFGINAFNVQPDLFLRLQHFFKFVFPKYTVINKNSR